MSCTRQATRQVLSQPSLSSHAWSTWYHPAEMPSPVWLVGRGLWQVAEEPFVCCGCSGHCSFYLPQLSAIFTGDTLFSSGLWKAL